MLAMARVLVGEPNLLLVDEPSEAPMIVSSAFFTHSRRVCAVQPILAETETIVAHRDGCSCYRMKPYFAFPLALAAGHAEVHALIS